jgi:hypothetical protein
MTRTFTSTTRRLPTSIRPQVERLEDRTCPSTVRISGAALVVQGDNADNTVQITDDGQGGVTATVDGQTVTGTGVQQIVVISRGGADDITYQLTGPLTTAKHLVLNTGDGDDVVNLDFAAGATGAAIKVDLNTFRGDDDVTADFGTLSATSLFFRNNLGDGNDTLDVTLAGGLVGASQARFLVQALKGDDTLGLHATGAVDPAALLDTNIHGGLGNDAIAVDYAGQLGGKFGLTVDGSVGQDTVTATLDAEAGSTGSVRATVRGGTGNDQLTLQVNDLAGGTSPGTDSLAALLALLDGGTGRDSAVATPNVKVVRCES